MPIRVLVYGLGPIGAAVARQLVARKGFALVGAVDVDREKVGLDVGQVIDLERRLKVRVTNDAAGGIRQAKPDVVVMCTSSSLKKALPSIETVLKLRTPIVSTTEELSYPVGRNRTIARAIDQMARKAKVAVVGTGVNPGFAMDALPVMLSGVCERIDSVRVDRVQDARIRRLPFQQKIGAGLTVDRCQEGRTDARHVGLAESITMIARPSADAEQITDEIVEGRRWRSRATCGS
jgi:4-hydroxy-tetrahydrodipicolinate reductase